MTQAALDFTDSGLDPAEKPRLDKQCLKILRLMIEGPATNAQLSQIALRYSARIFDIRTKAGITIKIRERNREIGVNLYGFDSSADRERAEALLA